MKQLIGQDRADAVRLYHESDVKEIAVVSFAGGAAAAFSARSPGKLSSSEDYAALISFGTDSGVLAVADGLGGLPAGEMASQIAVDQLARSVGEALREGGNLRAAILDGFDRANQAVIDLGVGAATTLAVVEIQGDVVRPYHVGDSMILVVGQRGKTKLRSVSHSPIGYAVEAGFLDHEEAMHHEERHLVSNILGTSDMHISIGSALQLDPFDTVLVASDGIADNLHLSEIVERIRKGTLQTAASTLAAETLFRMETPTPGQPSKPDDLTAILYRRKRK